MNKKIKQIFNYQIILFLVSIIISSFVIFYIFSLGQIEKRVLAKFESEINSLAMQLNYETKIFHENVNALTSRTMIRKELYKYYKGVISLDQVRKFTKAKYIEGASVYDDLIMCKRISCNGSEIAFYNNGKIKLPQGISKKSKAYFKFNAEYYIYFKNKIIQNGILIGYDIAVFKIGNFKEMTFLYLDMENISIIPQDITVENKDIYYGKRKIGNSDYSLQASLKKSVLKKNKVAGIKPVIIKTIILICLVIIISYFTIFKMLSNLFNSLENKNTELSESLKERDKLLRKSDNAIQQLKIASKEKSAFLANMSHEIRTPLNAVIGMTDLALMNHDDIEHLSYLQTVKESGHILLQLVNDILDFSKIEAGQLILEKREILLAQIIHSIDSMFRKNIEERGLNFIVLLDENLPKYVIADEIRLRQIIMNLISNSIKFTREGRIKLEVSLNNYNNKNAEIKFQISDTGIGIAEDKQKNLFSKYYQTDLSTTRKYGGTGLGLSIVKSLTEKMEGHIVVTSAEGVGTTFDISIPFAVPECNRIVQKENTKEKSNQNTKNRSNLKLLIAEDNKINALMAKTVLEKLNHFVMIAKDGYDCLSVLRKNDFDVILMDIEMPEMDGIEATQEIRKGACGEKKKNIPIIAMTAHAVAEIRDRSVSAGIDHYITKPIDISSIQSEIEKVF